MEFDSRIIIERISYEPITLTISDGVRQLTASLSQEKTKQLIELCRVQLVPKNIRKHYTSKPFQKHCLTM